MRFRIAFHVCGVAQCQVHSELDDEPHADLPTVPREVCLSSKIHVVIIVHEVPQSPCLVLVDTGSRLPCEKSFRPRSSLASDSK